LFQKPREGLLGVILSTNAERRYQIPGGRLNFNTNSEKCLDIV
jgi:hypothetical protein